MLTLLGKNMVISQKFTSTGGSQNSKKYSAAISINEIVDEAGFGADFMDFGGFL